MSENETRQTIKLVYSNVARQKSACCPPGVSCCGASVPSAAEVGYSPQDLAAIPEEAQAGLGCGNPLAIAALGEGETVVDLGPGLGMDAFLAATRVGPRGRVIGVDMTEEMIEGARRIAAEKGYTNVEFRLGQIEQLPLEAGTADVIISNCVINLSTDKDGVFREAFRVLKPGGRLAVSDTVSEKPLPEYLRNDLNAWASCIGGALQRDEYLASVEKAGFSDIQVTSEKAFLVEKDRDGNDVNILSITVNASKPGPPRVS